MSDLQVKGLAELAAALQQLPAKVEANLMRAALRAGAKVIAVQARANVHSVSGVLAKSVRFGAKLQGRGSGRVSGYVRAGGRGSKAAKAAFYAHMVEFGTARHVIKAPPGARLNVRGVFYRSVEHPGARKHPFMLPAFDAKGAAAVSAVAEYLRRRLASKHGIDVSAPRDPEAEE